MTAKQRYIREAEMRIRNLIKKRTFDSLVEAREFADEFYRDSRYVRRLYPWNIRGSK